MSGSNPAIVYAQNIMTQLKQSMTFSPEAMELDKQSRCRFFVQDEFLLCNSKFRLND